jgi:parallel beta-helix repeat protein
MMKVSSSMKMAVLLSALGTLCGCGGGSGGTLGGTSDTSSIMGNPGLRNEDGSTHILPASHPATGTAIDVTKPPYNADPADNGTDDRPAVEAAINAAQPGDEIYFPNGVYNLGSASVKDSNTNIRLKSGVNLRGESENGVILKTTFDDTGSGTGSHVVLCGIAIQDLSVTQMTITSTWNRSFSMDTTVGNPEAGGPTFAIEVRNYSTDLIQNAVARITFDHVKVERFRRIGIFIGPGCREVAIRHCVARDATDLGGGGAGYGFGVAGFGHQSADGNPFLGTTKDTFWNVVDGCETEAASGGITYIRHAVLLQSWTHNNLIENGTFRGVQIDAIDLHGEDEYNNEICSNTITGVVNEAGIGIGNGGATHDRSGPYNYIYDNTNSVSKKGIVCEFGSSSQNIVRNQITGCSQWGIGLGKSDRTQIRDNRVSDSGKGIYLFHNDLENEEPAGDPTSCTVMDNVLSGNSDGTVHVTRGPQISDANWNTNQLQ